MDFRLFLTGVGCLSVAGFLYGENPEVYGLWIFLLVIIGLLAIVLTFVFRKPHLPHIDVKNHHDLDAELRRLQIQAIEREMRRAIRRQKGQ